MPTAAARPLARLVQIPQTRMPNAISTGLRDTVRRLRRRWRQRRELMAMDAIGLHDLSLTDADARCEAERPFWSDLRIPARDTVTPLNRPRT